MLFCDRLKKVEIFVALAFWLTVIKKYARAQVRKSWLESMQIEFKKVLDIYSAINIDMAVYSMYQFGGLIF